MVPSPPRVRALAIVPTRDRIPRIARRRGILVHAPPAARPSPFDLARGMPRTFWVLWCGMLVNRAGSFVVPFLAIYLTQARGLSAAQAGIVAALYGAGPAVASPLGGLGMIALGFARDVAVIAPACFLVAMVGESYRPA